MGGKQEKAVYWDILQSQIHVIEQLIWSLHARKCSNPIKKRCSHRIAAQPLKQQPVKDEADAPAKFTENEQQHSCYSGEGDDTKGAVESGCRGAS